MKRKRGGKYIADLAKHGDEIMVARGGRGGVRLHSLECRKIQLISDRIDTDELRYSIVETRAFIFKVVHEQSD